MGLTRIERERAKRVFCFSSIPFNYTGCTSKNHRAICGTNPKALLFHLSCTCNADLLEICDRSGTNISVLGFGDDAYMLAYGKKRRGKIVQRWKLFMENAKKWAERHGAVFAPAKYEFIHLSRFPKRFNMAATINIATIEIEPKADIRVLGLQIDIKLKWGPHIRKTQEKMTRQSMALTKIIHVNLGCLIFQSKAGIYSGCAPSHDLQLSCMAHAQRCDRQKIETFHRQASCDAEQMSSYHCGSLQSYSYSSS